MKPGKICLIEILKPVLIAFGLFAFASCTVAPLQISGNGASIDSSTPSQYGTKDTSGFLYYTDAGDGVFTTNAIAEYNNLISLYQLKLKNQYAITIVANDHVKPFTDKYGNSVYIMDAQYVKYFAVMDSWLRSGVPSDSDASKIVNAMGSVVTAKPVAPPTTAPAAAKPATSTAAKTSSPSSAAAKPATTTTPAKGFWNWLKS